MLPRSPTTPKGRALFPLVPPWTGPAFGGDNCRALASTTPCAAVRPYHSERRMRSTISTNNSKARQRSPALLKPSELGRQWRTRQHLLSATQGLVASSCAGVTAGLRGRCVRGSRLGVRQSARSSHQPKRVTEQFNHHRDAAGIPTARFTSCDTSRHARTDGHATSAATYRCGSPRGRPDDDARHLCTPAASERCCCGSGTGCDPRADLLLTGG
jgi:hypothetical protein